jgi:hypothetical protein
MVVLLHRDASDIESALAIQELLRRRGHECRLQWASNLQLTPSVVADCAIKHQKGKLYTQVICLSDGKAVGVIRPAEQFRQEPKPDQKGYGDPFDITFGDNLQTIVNWVNT